MTSAEALQTADPAEAPVGTHALGSKIDYLLTAVDSGRIGSMSFAIDDIPYYVFHKKDKEGKSRICVQAILGYLPFSIDAREKRQAIMLILSASHTLPTVRFGLDPHNRIFAAGNFTAKNLASPGFAFFPLQLFLQEATPFITLIGQYF